MLTNTLYAGLSGMDVNQAKLNVVGNNIANANTVAFKSTRIEFKPQFYVTDSAGTAPTADNGGSNPSQRGLGAVVSGLERNFAAGAMETTGKATDLAIDGNGFFVVRGDEQKYTRDGTFELNPGNQLVTNAGDFVQGYGVDANFNIAGGKLVDLSVPMGTSTTAQATSKATLEGNLDASGTAAAGSGILNSQALTTIWGMAPDSTTLLTNVADTADPTTPLFAMNDTLTFAPGKGGRDLPSATFTVSDTSTLGDLLNFYNQNLGIDNTVVPPAGMPTPGVTLLNDATNPSVARIAVVSNSGQDNAISLTPGSFVNAMGKSPFTFADGVNANGIASDPTGESVHTSFVVYDSLGAAVNVSMTAALEQTSTAGTQWRFYAETANAGGGSTALGDGTLTFDNNGKLQSSTGTTLAIDRTGTGAASPLAVKLDFSQMTSLASSDSELVMTSQDGAPSAGLPVFPSATTALSPGRSPMARRARSARSPLRRSAINRAWWIAAATCSSKEPTAARRSLARRGRWARARWSPGHWK